MGTRAVADDGPASFTLTVVRGDDVSRVFEFYTEYTDDTTNTPLDLTGRTYSSSIAATKGGTAVATPTCTTPDPTNGQVVWSFTDSTTDALTEPRYVFDVVENAGTTSERTVILGLINMTGRATA
jgi:hypothetical protein